MNGNYESFVFNDHHVLGLLGISFGAIFVYQGVIKNTLIVDRMKIEKVSIALDPSRPQQVAAIGLLGLMSFRASSKTT